MNLIVTIIYLLGHWVGDFLFQNIYGNKLSNKKDSKKDTIKKLLKHVLIYSVILTTFTLLLNIIGIIQHKYFLSLIYFFIITYITHLLTDFIMIKKIQNVLKKNNRNRYMNTLGFDQFIHGSFLFITFEILYLL